MENCPEEFRKMIKEFEYEEQSEEQIPESFVCSICCDLLFKPVVLGCGHVFCFWCVRKSMNARQKSSCAICRNVYCHFPYICHSLHFLLSKLYPNAYERRAKQALEEENEIGVYAPRLGSAACSLKPEEIAVQLVGDLETKVANLLISETGETSAETGATSAKMAIVESNLAQHGDEIRSVYHDPKQIHCDIVSVADVLCGLCKLVLYRPIVLNCGHAFCICCVVPDAHEVLKCEVCQCPHPGDFPKVCLEFDKFLEKQFPAAYKLKSDKMKPKQISNIAGAGSDISCTSQSSAQNLRFDGVSVIHSGVGCDSCGMTPIVGDRYKCKDCKENIGYNLCEDCYPRFSNIRGRFNQQHKPDHEFGIVVASDVSGHDLEDLAAAVSLIESAHRDILYLSDFWNEIISDRAIHAAMNEDLDHYEYYDVGDVLPLLDDENENGDALYAEMIQDLELWTLPPWPERQESESSDDEPLP